MEDIRRCTAQGTSGCDVCLIEYFDGSHRTAAEFALDLRIEEFDTPALEKYPIIEEGIWENLHLNPEASLFYLSREYRGLENHVNQWWRDRTKELAKWIDPTDVDRGFDTVQEKLRAIEYHPYHSKEWCPPFRTFESQEFTFELVNLAMERNAWIIVGRCKNHWLASVPGLRGYERVIKNMKSSRSVHLSKKNLGSVTFGRIARAMLAD